MTRWAVVLASLLAGALIDLAYWSYEGRPLAVPDAGAAHFASVSFSPYRRGESPLLEISPTLDEIAEDVQVLAGRADGIRTYTSLEGLEAVPRLARPFGLKVMQGAWLGREPATNEQEIASVIDLAHRFPDVIGRVVVGNEVILRRDLTPAQLAAYIDRVRAAIKQPVTYADVWEFWLKTPELAPHVDFITIHILPYWEDAPIAIEHALDHVTAVLRIVQAAFPGKKVMIGEVGWPSFGRMRAAAAPTLANEARLIRGFIRRARAEGLDYNLFAAFDEPWKRNLEGTVGAHWGLYDVDRAPKFALSGPVSNDPSWPWHFSVSSGIAVLAALWAGLPRRALGFPAWLALAASGELLGTLLMHDAMLTSMICWSPFGWIAGALGLAASALLAAMLTRALATALAGSSWPSQPLPVAAEAINLLRGNPTPGPSLGERGLGLLQFGFVTAAAVATVALVVDPRYRDFPSEAFLLPALGFAAFSFFPRGTVAHSALQNGTHMHEEAVLVALLLLGGIGVLVREGLRNTEALGWCATLLLLALPWALRLARARRAARAAGPRRSTLSPEQAPPFQH
jgi:exo-beta-1,3-glucanase (GH17 family)